VLYWLAVGLHGGASVAAAAAVGATIAFVGELVIPFDAVKTRWLVLCVLAAALLLRELGVTSLPLPQVRRQTVGFWYRRRGILLASLLWGLDLGPGLWTFVTFSGYWLIIAALPMAHSAAAGGALLGAYGAGRAVAVVLPAAVTRSYPLISALEGVDSDRLGLFRIHRLLLVGTAAGAFLGAAI
jgi:hypothetical protein